MTVLLALSACDPAPIADALDARCGERSELPDPGGDLHRVTLDDPAAVCNDGTPAVLYARAATDPAHARDFVVYLNAGASCGSERDCTERWCGARWLMSSVPMPLTLLGEGLLAPDPQENAFAGWNAVSVAYCTSDAWTGTNPVAELTGRRHYTLAFRGDDVVRAALDALDAGAASDDGGVALPSLAEADRIVFGGASAGGQGALHQLDRFVARYADARVTALVDGPLLPAPGTLPAAVQERADRDLERTFADVFEDLWHARLDDSCVAAGLGWRCLDAFRVEADHVEHPFLVRHDLYDPIGAEPYLAAGAGEDEYAAAGATSASDLAALRPDVAVLAPACGDHIVTIEPLFSTETVADGDGASWSLGAAAASYADNGKPIVAVDTPDGDGSACPSEP